MQTHAIQIGAISFQGFEIPSALQFGGTQRLAVHRLYGGRRIVEALGPEPHPIRFEGTFTGADASARVRAIEDLRISGQRVGLTWGAFNHRVIVQDVVAEYRNAWWILFRVTCVVVDNREANASSLQPSLGNVLGDLASAAAAAGTLMDLSGLQNALIAPGALVPGTSGQVQAYSAATSAVTSLDGILAQQPGTIAPATPVGGASLLAGQTMATVATAGAMASAAATRGYLSRISANVAG